MESDMLPDEPQGEALDRLIPVVAKNLRATTETLAYMHYEEGPALQTHAASIYGPIELADSEQDRYWQGRSSGLIGERAGRTEAKVVADFVDRFLPKAFRRSVPEGLKAEYRALAEAEIERSGRLNDGLHLGASNGTDIAAFSVSRVFATVNWMDTTLRPACLSFSLIDLLTTSWFEWLEMVRFFRLRSCGARPIA